MFSPHYTITYTLLDNIKRISVLVSEFNHRRFSSPVLAQFEKSARSLSTYASTSIEGNPLPLTEVRRILKSTPQHVRESEREVLNYNQALVHLNKRIDSENQQLTLSLILETHQEVMHELLPKNERGKLRKHPVVVHNPKTNQIAFIPPDAHDVPDLVFDLIHFVYHAQKTVDPLIVAGIFHKQMVLIHPFMDGNGRTTRLMTKFLLVQLGLNTFHLFSFENYYNNNVTRYFQTVGEFGDYYEQQKSIDFTHWLEYFTEGIIDELLRVQKLFPELEQSVETQQKRALRVHDQKALKYIAKHGQITNELYATITDRSKASRTKDLQRLVRWGFIVPHGRGKATYYTKSS